MPLAIGSGMSSILRRVVVPALAAVVAFFAFLFLPACGAEPDRPEPIGESAAAVSTTTFVARAQTWWLWYDGVDRGDYWRQHDWEPEPGVISATIPIGYGESYVNTLSYGPDPANKPITAYFRKAFYVPDIASLARLQLQIMYDDGFVFYINGKEGKRASMPSGPIRYETRALGHEANATYFDFDVTGSISDLQLGWNTMAIEVHQESPSSSDLVFDASLVGFIRQSSDHAINHGDSWAYRDSAAGVPEGWNQLGFDTSSWTTANGPLGYGETYVNPIPYGPDPTHKPRTVYFVHSFTVADPSDWDGITADVMFDDGFVAYLNGHEVARDFMPLGTVNGNTLAWDHEAHHAYGVYDFGEGVPYLQAGENVLAVEVHQTSEASSDLVFDLAMGLHPAE